MVDVYWGYENCNDLYYPSGRSITNRGTYIHEAGDFVVGPFDFPEKEKKTDTYALPETKDGTKIIKKEDKDEQPRKVSSETEEAKTQEERFPNRGTILGGDVGISAPNNATITKPSLSGRPTGIKVPDYPDAIQR
jgi:hypothetical protein